MKNKDTLLINIKNRDFSSNNSLLSLSEYRIIAEKIIKKTAVGHQMRKFLINEENLTYITEQVIYADLKFDPNKWKTNKHIGKCWHRKYRATNAIKRIIQNNKKNITHKPLHDKIINKKPNPYQLACYNDMIQFFKDQLTPRQSEIFQQYFIERYTLKEIAKEQEVTFQRIHVIIEDIRRALKKTNYDKTY